MAAFVSSATCVSPAASAFQDKALDKKVASQTTVTSVFYGNRLHGLSAAAPKKCGNRSSRVVMQSAAKEKPRPGSKDPTQETLLTPRFYTTDFDEMEQLFSHEIYPNLDEEELQACLEEFKADYNQTHFVRNPNFKAAADKIQGPARDIFVEFLERSCTAEFSGFLLYKELGRRLKKTSPLVAEIFTLMSRDEARHAGFLNKALADFNLALDLGFLTKARKYTFFKPQYILYATYLSEKIGYWRYITICRHLYNNPEFQMYPIFGKFENWCQDENRHGDFIAAMLKCHPKFLTHWTSKLWARFFCLSVYVTMYVNDHQRAAFYEGLGLNPKQFDLHVIIETNKTTARLFPAVLDCENPEFERRLDHLVELNTSIVRIESSEAPEFVKKIQKLPLVTAVAGELLAMYLMRPVDSGSVDFLESEAQLVY